MNWHEDLIIGAAGMVGRKVTAALLERGTMSGQAIFALTLVDVVAPYTVALPCVEVSVSGVHIADPQTAKR